MSGATKPSTGPAAAPIVTGRVTRVNNTGFQVEGRDGWLNISKFAASGTDVPRPGQTVRVELDRGGYVYRLAALAGVDEEPIRIDNRAPASDRPPLPPEPARPPATLIHRPQMPGRDDKPTVTRLAVLNTATAILASGGRSAEPDAVIGLAARLEQWAIREG